MKKKILFLFVVISLSGFVSAQNGTAVRQKIVIFTPLYLDSVFDAAGNYQFDKSFPKFINPGLEFYEGVQLAIDSMKKEGVKLDVQIYDTRSTVVSLASQLSSPELDSVDLIIAHPAGNEIRLIADAAMRKNIPFINATAPVNGGVTGNPFYTQLTPTLKTQIEGTYKYMQKYYPLDLIIVFRKKGVREDEIKSYFEEASQTTVSVPLKLKYVDLPDSFTVKHLTAHLDSTSKFLCVAGSLDESFGMRISSQLASIGKTYPLAVLGMSTWNNISFARPEFKGIEIIYGTPFYHSRMDKASMSIINHFNTKMYARPSDMVFRGYEVFMRYARLLMQFKNEIASQLASKQFKVFTDFDIQPVINRSTLTMEYFENKRLSFVKWKDGIITGINF